MVDQNALSVQDRDPDSDAQIVEREIMRKCHDLMTSIGRTDPGWMAYYEDALPDTADREVVIDLMRSAPNPFAMGVLYGKFLLRIEIAQITGREFL